MTKTQQPLRSAPHLPVFLMRDVLAPISIEHPGRLLDLSAAIEAGKESIIK
jgi:hypothetical protein